MRRRVSQLSAWMAAALVTLVAAETKATLPPVPETFVTQEGGWLRLEYPPASRARIPGLLDVADAAREEIGSALGRPVLWQARIRVAQSSGELPALSPEPLPPGASSAAFPRFELVLLSLEGLAGEEIDAGRALRRELAHLAIHEATDGHVPARWFALGFGAEMAGAQTLSSKLVLISATVRGKLIPLSRLDQAMEVGASAPLAIAQSRDFVHFLRAKGPAAFAGLIDRLRRGEPFSAALEAAYGEPSHVLERAFRDRATMRHGYFPILAAIGFIGASSFGISAWRSSRRRQGPEPEQEPDELLPPEPQGEPIAEPQPRIRIALNRRPGHALAAADLEIPKVQHRGRWHTLH